MKKIFFLLLLSTLLFAVPSESYRNGLASELLVHTQYPYLYSSDDSVNISDGKINGAYPKKSNGAEYKNYIISIADDFIPPAIIGSFIVKTSTSSTAGYDGDILGIDSILTSSIKMDENYFERILHGSTLVWAYKKDSWKIAFKLKISSNNIFIKYTPIYENTSGKFNAVMDDIRTIFVSGSSYDYISFGVKDDDVETAKILVTIYYIP